MPRISRYPFEAVCQHIHSKHLGCPNFAMEYISKEIAGREWKGATRGGDCRAKQAASSHD